MNAAADITGSEAGCTTGRTLLIAMEGCWLAALLTIVDQLAAEPRFPWIVAAVLFYPLAGYAARKVRARTRMLRTETIVAAGIFAVAVAAWAAVLLPLSVPTGFGGGARLIGVAVIGGFAWTRGWLTAGRGIAVPGFAAAFQGGLVMTMVALALADALGLGGRIYFGFAGGFILLGLTGLWRVRSAGATMGRPSGLGAPGIGLAFLSLVLVGTFGMALWSAVDRSALDRVLASLAWVRDQILVFLGYLAGLLRDAAVEKGDIPGDILSDRRPDTPVPVRDPSWLHSPLAQQVLEAIAWVTLIACCGLLSYWAWRYLVRWYQRSSVTRNLVYAHSTASFLDGLQAFWRTLPRYIAALRAWMGRWARRLAWRPLSENSVAEVYRRMQRGFMLQGLRRARHETPIEYLRRLKGEWPGDPSDLETITAAFVADRYGPIPIDPRAARAAWSRLGRAIKKMRKGND
jgi:hypothetical protein